MTRSRANNLHRSHQQIFQHQSSVSSTASIQTVFHQSIYNSNTGADSNGVGCSGGNKEISIGGDRFSTTGYNANSIKATSNNQMILSGTNSNMHQSNGIGHIPNTNSASSLELHSSNLPQQRPTQSGSLSLLPGNSNCGGGQMFQQHIGTQSSNVSIAEESLSIGDVADLLHPQYAIITGGRSREGCPIITFPDNNNFHLLTEHDYEKLISYLTSVPP